MEKIVFNRRYFGVVAKATQCRPENDEKRVKVPEFSNSTILFWKKKTIFQKLLFQPITLQRIK